MGRRARRVGDSAHRLGIGTDPQDFVIVTSDRACCPCGSVLSAGIKSGMNSGSRSYPTWQDVAPAVGDKVIDAVVAAVKAAKDDLADYRSFRPAWVAQASERGLATWIHDRLWFHVAAALGELPHVTVIDKGVLREFTVGPETSLYRFRVKRHQEDGDVSTYPTELALEFLAQVEDMLDIFDELHLIAGYKWDRDERAMGSPVISLRDGRHHLIWEHDLSSRGDESTGSQGLPSVTEPPAPAIDGIIKDADRLSDDHE